MTTWADFKQELRRKFRGTFTAADFFKVIYENTMGPNQAPMDFYQQLEAFVSQGYREHREAIGDPGELIRRVFLAGIPLWLRDLLSLKDNCTPQELAEAAQRVWNSHHGIGNGGQDSRHKSPNELPFDPLSRHRYRY